MPTKRKISEFKPLFTNLAQTSHYEVKFGGLPSQLLAYLSRKGITSNFIYNDVGLLCFSTQLPATSFALATINGNNMGLAEKFAHTRQYSAILLEFYVDKNYNALKFMESWMEFIASGSNNPIDSNLGSLNQSRKDYIFRMQYPDYYKCDRTSIVKFDRDYKKEIEYSFIGLFPSSISALPVSYNSSEILKMAVTFEYDRYIAGKSLSLNIFRGDSNNEEPKSPQPTNSNPETPKTSDITNNRQNITFYDRKFTDDEISVLDF